MILLLAAIPSTISQAEPQEGVMTVTSFDGTAIDIIVCKPDGASASNPAPVVLHSHGWGGSRHADCGAAQSWLDEGWGLVSISQRGFGASGGEAHVHDPLYEGRDNLAVIDRIAQFDWVMMESPGDPVLAAIGGSYGGGYQFLTAFVETAATGTTRLDALAPEITWHDLPESLAPNGVVRTAWVAALYAVGAPSVHDGIHQAFAYGATTGQWPDGSVPGTYNLDADFHDNGPVAWVEAGHRLDVPVLIGQGTTDNLFNLNQGWKNFERALTPTARAASYFIGYNGGHALPSITPPGGLEAQVGGNVDPCSAPYGGYTQLARAFFANVIFGETNPMPPADYSIATVDGDCLHLDALDNRITANAGTLVTTTGAGAPQYVPILTGPATIAGIPTLDATATSLGIEQRAFIGLARGTTPADAKLLSNNMMPLRVATPTLGAHVEVELAGVAAEIGEGETLYLVLSPISDMSIAHGSRTAGAMLLQDVEVGVPMG